MQGNAIRSFGIGREPRALLPALTGIRAVAASWVVLQHFNVVLVTLIPAAAFLTPFMLSGVLGVDIFFTLSGFIIAYTYADRFRRFSWREYRKFLTLRVARIYPVHVFTLAVGVALIAAAAVLGQRFEWTDSANVPNIVGNLLMLQSSPLAEPVNIPAWSIATEFAAYLAFPLVALGLVWMTSARRGLVAAFAVSLVGTVCLITYRIDGLVGTLHTWQPWLRILFEFTAGALLYAGWRHLANAERYSGVLAWVGLAGIVTIAALIGGDERASQIFTALPFISLLILGLASARGVIGRVLGSRLMAWGGARLLLRLHDALLRAPCRPKRPSLRRDRIATLDSCGGGDQYARRCRRCGRGDLLSHRRTR